MAAIAFLVTSWEPDAAATRALVDNIASQGVDRRAIRVSDERISRPITLNRAIASSDADYIGFCESDVLPSPNAVATLARLLDRDPRIGLAAAKVEQLGDQLPVAAAVPSAAPDAPDQEALEDISGQMWTLNFVLYRKSTQVLFDEDYFGNQIFDWDFGLELRHRGYTSVADARCAVLHRATDYTAKSLSYHACVARNRQIFENKWGRRPEWKGLAAFQAANPGVIPTIEELTHATEAWQFKYVAEFDQYSFQEFYFNARFGDPTRVEAFLREARPFLLPNVWAPPVMTGLQPRRDDIPGGARRR